LVIFAIAQRADAATITVDSLADPGAPSICALRDAINAANNETAVNGCAAGTGNDTIVFSVTGTITLASELPSIAHTLTIQGPSANPPAITIDGEDRFFNPWFVDSGATLNLSSVTLTATSTVFNEGTLSVTNSAFTGTATGAISNEGSLEVSNSTFSGNSDVAINSRGPLSVTNSTFTDNSSVFGGGQFPRMV
jgi:hypothetical protein